MKVIALVVHWRMEDQKYGWLYGGEKLYSFRKEMNGLLSLKICIYIESLKFLNDLTL